VFNEGNLHRHLQSFLSYYHGSRTHLGLQKDTPEPRPVQSPETGRIISIPELGACITGTSAELPEQSIGLRLP
jgi:hypothetical protein